MFTISAKEASRVRGQLRELRLALNQEITDIYQGFITIAYDSVVDKTPQWTGHATAQWNIGINQIDVSRSHKYLKDNLAVSQSVESRREPAQTPTKAAGHPEAIEEAKSRQTGFVQQIKLDDMVFISNNVESLLTGAYATKLEANPNDYLRPENDPGHMVARTLEWYNSRLAVIDKASRAKLRLVRLSDSGIMEQF